jgi:hypothetical protein
MRRATTARPLLCHAPLQPDGTDHQTGVCKLYAKSVCVGKKCVLGRLGEHVLWSKSRFESICRNCSSFTEEIILNGFFYNDLEKIEVG